MKAELYKQHETLTDQQLRSAGASKTEASPKVPKVSPLDYDMPKTLSDDTKVPCNDKGCAWKVMKRYSMKPDIERAAWYKAAGYSEKDARLIRALVSAQRATGDEKGPLEEVPNPEADESGDANFDPFSSDV